MMSTDYTQTLKSIKEAEEVTSKQIADKKKVLAEELQHLQEEADKAISATKAEAEAYIAKEIEKAKSAEQIEADKLLASSEKDANEIAAKKINKTEFKKIIQEVLFSEFNAV